MLAGTVQCDQVQWESVSAILSANFSAKQAF